MRGCVGFRSRTQHLYEALQPRCVYTVFYIDMSLYREVSDVCSHLGCNLPDNHKGLCQVLEQLQPRTRGAPKIIVPETGPSFTRMSSGKVASSGGTSSNHEVSRRRDELVGDVGSKEEPVRQLALRRWSGIVQRLRKVPCICHTHRLYTHMYESHTCCKSQLSPCPPPKPQQPRLLVLLQLPDPPASPQACCTRC